MDYDVAIIGGGLTGVGALYVLSKYTNIDDIALVEKEEELARGSSHKDTNSQTLHFGYEQTHYTREKVEKTSEAAGMVARYAEENAEDSFEKRPMMVIGVGEYEVEQMKEWYEEIEDVFPYLRMIGKEEIAEFEPKVVEGRDPDTDMIALISEEEYIMDYSRLAESFAEESEGTGKADISTGEKVEDIEEEGEGYEISTSERHFTASFVLVAAGSYSLVFAKDMGYGKDLGLLPVAGNYYSGRDLVNGKVYTFQIPGLPFAAVHGDADIHDAGETRFGPVAKVLPWLEKGNLKSMGGFLKTSAFSIDGILSLINILSDKTILKFVLKSLSYDIPFLGKWFFKKFDAEKIIPNVKYGDLRYRSDLGGIRPQVVDTEEKKLALGEAKIEENGILFDITPSPGATACLKNAEKNAKKIVSFLDDARFYYSKFNKDLKE